MRRITTRQDRDDESLWIQNIHWRSLEASGSVGEGVGWMFRDHRAASRMTLVPMTTPNTHKVFPAIPKLPKRVGRGFQNILHKGGISSQQSCYTKKKKKVKKKWGEGKKTEKLELFYQVLGCFWVFF